MKRDMDLVRAIVLAIEAAPGYAPEPLTIPNYAPEHIGHHVYLMIQGGLLEGSDITAQGAPCPQAIATCLTWTGHEFADAARNDTRWSTAKKVVTEKAGSVTVEVLTKLLSSLTTSTLGLPG